MQMPFSRGGEKLALGSSDMLSWIDLLEDTCSKPSQARQAERLPLSLAAVVCVHVECVCTIPIAVLCRERVFPSPSIVNLAGDGRRRAWLICGHDGSFLSLSFLFLGMEKEKSSTQCPQLL